MLYESTAVSFLVPDESGLSEHLVGWARTDYFRPGWAISKIVMAALLMAYLAGWAQDLQRLRHLEAEPPPPFKVITKHEAWRLIHPRPMR
jgi:hypothetical protein